MTDLTRAPALLTIDVAAIAANWKRLAALVAPAAAAAVVKADCYGLGMERIAPVLYAEGCRTFFVACLDEGITLRKAVPGAVIKVLSGPLGGDEAEFAHHNLIPVLNSLAQMTGWASFAKKGSGAPAAAIHIDTGMNRLGLSESELERLAAKPEILAALRPVLVMSHLACADDADSPMNARQLTTLRRLASHLPALPQSMAASSGIFLGRAYHLGLVRPGAALYGLNPMPGRPNPMSQVVTLQGKIVQVRDVDSPQTVGYGATHRIEGRRKLAVVAAGYADGLFRSLSNRGHGFIGEFRVPIVGRVSMDLTIFDVTDLPEGMVHPGALVELMGPRLAADTVADQAGTIGYEVLTSLGHRYHRRWLGTEKAP